ncbi:hypothetical protein M758_4G197300 [Ceratodon purpureus]|uniref:Wax synthase domain-containing protein n=1 Tax=Ceratodon purpureus TaxID=3225 RepID=A0A8T0ID04_CERPU|nr:hypothetical protein KC19_4G194000 [Ceratodon purpureus]KAG0620196.1 hypothetical protein M758_4G197300 [Ceratodon purpureus]
MAVLGFEVQGWRDGLAIGHMVAILAAAYCYWIVRRLPQGLPRLIVSTPLFVVFAYLPLIFNRQTHLVGIAMFYCIMTWMATFKVLLLCWNTGPGSDPWVANCFPRFAIVMTYPAHMKRTGKVVKKVPVAYTRWVDHVTKSEVWYMLLLRSALKLIALVIILQLLLQPEPYPKIIIHLLFSIQLYLFVTIVLEILAAFANTVFGITIEPHFDNPFAAVSLEEFWARRWNLLVSNALRETVFNPVYYLLQKLITWHQEVSLKRSKSDVTESMTQDFEAAKEPKDGRGFDLPKLLAMLAAFLVSGLAHELSVYYVTLKVTWEMNSFFVVQGIAVALEAAWKIYVPGIRPTRIVGKLLTLTFAFITSHWLFWPPIDGVSDQVLLEVKRMLPL